jgi:hypothetical protein
MRTSVVKERGIDASFIPSRDKRAADAGIPHPGVLPKSADLLDSAALSFFMNDKESTRV